MFLYSFRRRRSPSPARRRRSPSPPRRRRSPSPPRRRYCHNLALIFLLGKVKKKNFTNSQKSIKKHFSSLGLLPLHLVVDLCPQDVFLPPSSAATAPHLCLHRKGSYQVHPQNAFLLVPSDALLGLLNAETLHHQEDALLLLLLLHRDTGGAL